MDEKILGKIKKLLRLSTSSNANESQNAMLKAQQLMLENGIAMSDVNLGELAKKEVIEGHGKKSGKIIWWHKQLGAILADNFRCVSITTTFGKENKRSIGFIGLKQDVEMVSAVHEFAITSIMYHIKEFQEILKNRFGQISVRRKNAITNDFVAGYLDGLCEKFRRQVEQKQEYGLVLVRDKEVDDYVDQKKMKNARQEKTNLDGNAIAYTDGFVKGLQFEMINGHIEQGA